MSNKIVEVVLNAIIRFNISFGTKLAAIETKTWLKIY